MTRMSGDGVATARCGGSGSTARTRRSRGAAVLGCGRGVRLPAGGHGVTTEMAHGRARSCSWTGWSYRETPWGEAAYVLVGALSYSGRMPRGGLRGQDRAHLVEHSTGCCGGWAAPARGGPTGWRQSSSPGRDRLLRSSRRAGQALRRHGVRSARAAAAAQRRGRGRDRIPGPLVVAHGAGRRHPRQAQADLTAGACGRRSAPARRGTIAAARRARALLRAAPRGRSRRGWRSSASSHARRWSRSRATATASRRAWRAARSRCAPAG